MAVIKYTSEEVKLLARLMRAEAEGEGKLGMLLVGNVGVNRVLANCFDFKHITSITKMVFQSPGGFEATQFSYFYQAARNSEIALAKRVIKGEKFEPASRALLFYNPFGAGCRSEWYQMWNTGKYKSHCFYAPTESQNCF